MIKWKVFCQASREDLGCQITILEFLSKDSSRLRQQIKKSRETNSWFLRICLMIKSMNQSVRLMDKLLNFTNLSCYHG